MSDFTFAKKRFNCANVVDRYKILKNAVKIKSKLVMAHDQRDSISYIS